MIYSQTLILALLIKKRSLMISSEAQKASVDKTEEIDLLFFLPKAQRDLKLDITIKKRLLTHFKRHAALLDQERKKLVKTGILFLTIGIILMAIATFFLYKYEYTIPTSFAIILFEPASWFLFWEGLTLIIFTSKKKQPLLTFYEKMSRARIFFSSTIK